MNRFMLWLCFHTPGTILGDIMSKFYVPCRILWSLLIPPPDIFTAMLSDHRIPALASRDTEKWEKTHMTGKNYAVYDTNKPKNLAVAQVTNSKLR
jgi:hypothetical protein